MNRPLDPKELAGGSQEEPRRIIPESMRLLALGVVDMRDGICVLSPEASRRP